MGFPGASSKIQKWTGMLKIAWVSRTLVHFAFATRAGFGDEANTSGMAYLVCPKYKGKVENQFVLMFIFGISCQLAVILE